MTNKLKSVKPIKALVIILELLALCLAAYLIILPFYPSIQYKINTSKDSGVNYKDIGVIKKITEEIVGLPINTDRKTNNSAFNEVANAENSEKKKLASNSADSATNIVKISNTLIIPKIGVNIPIIESKDEKYGLNHGSWKLPGSSNPKENGNMILTGHRFKYLPPSNLTFYLLDKLETGDIVSVIWDSKTYYYRVKETKIVSADDTSILKQTKEPTLTIYTCDPVYSTKNRLVIISEQI